MSVIPRCGHPGTTCISSCFRGSRFSFSSLLVLWRSEDQWSGTAPASWELTDLGSWWPSHWRTGSGREPP